MKKEVVFHQLTDHQKRNVSLKRLDNYNVLDTSTIESIRKKIK